MFNMTKTRNEILGDPHCFQTHLGNSHPQDFSCDPVLVAPRSPTFPSVTICLACSQGNNRRIRELKHGALCPLLIA